MPAETRYDPMRNEQPSPTLIRTVSGRYVNVLHPDPETLCIGDIAHALSHTPRFGGHLPVFYSVAQHSISVCQLTPQPWKLQALMHDASDAFLGDMPSPIKQHLPDFAALESRLMDVLAARFQFPWPMDPLVATADRVALESEWAGIMLSKVRTEDYNQTPEEARNAFLRMYEQLTK